MVFGTSELSLKCKLEGEMWLVEDSSSRDVIYINLNHGVYDHMHVVKALMDVNLKYNLVTNFNNWVL